MTAFRTAIPFLLFAILACWRPALANASRLDFRFELIGRTFETGGFPPSVPGDVVTMVGVVDDYRTHGPDDPRWDPSSHSYTFVVSELVVTEQIEFQSVRVVHFANAAIRLLEDSLPSDHVYGINPPNSTSPSTFADGSVLLEGVLSEASLTYNLITTSGSFIALVDLTGGSFLDALPCQEPVVLDSSIRNPGEDGYDLSVDGDLRPPLEPPCQPTPVEPGTWGRIKAMFQE